jgi:hypothetical protein
VPEPSAAEVKVAIRKLKRYKHQVLIRFQQRTDSSRGGGGGHFIPRYINILC